MLAHADDRDEVPLAGDRVGLGDAVDVGELAAERGQRRALGLDEDDRVGHARVGLARLEHDDLRAGRRLSTSALNACASVSIGGNVS